MKSMIISRIKLIDTKRMRKRNFWREWIQNWLSIHECICSRRQILEASHISRGVCTWETNGSITVRTWVGAAQCHINPLKLLGSVMNLSPQGRTERTWMLVLRDCTQIICYPIWLKSNTSHPLVSTFQIPKQPKPKSSLVPIWQFIDLIISLCQ